MKEKLWFYLALNDDSEQQKNIDLDYSTIWMLLLGGALLLTAIYLLLNRFYWLEAWVKKAFHGMIGVAIVASVGLLGLTYSGCGAEAESDSQQIEAPVEENQIPVNSTETSERTNTNVVAAVSSVGADLKSKIQGIIKTKVKPALETYNTQRATATDKSAARNAKRKIVNLEAVELLLSTRIGYVEDAEKQAQNGNLSAEAFENRIAELGESVDSLVNKYKLK